MQLLPVLKSESWLVRNPDAMAHVWIGTPDEPVVVVAYAHHDETTLGFVTIDDPAANDREALVREAFDNLENYESDFEVVEADGDRMLVAAGNPFAAERVMCESHMLRAHEELATDSIVVSVTRRGMMLACALDCSDGVKTTMSTLHDESWQAAGDDRILGDFIMFRSGLMRDVLPFEKLPGVAS